MTPAPFDLTGKVAIVTGPTRGNGAINAYPPAKTGMIQLARNLAVDGGTVITDGS